MFPLNQIIEHCRNIELVQNIINACISYFNLAYHNVNFLGFISNIYVYIDTHYFSAYFDRLLIVKIEKYPMTKICILWFVVNRNN